MPRDTENVPTYYTTRQYPSTAQNQLDYAFALRGFHKRVTVRALNSVEEWRRATTAACSSQSRENRRHNHCGGHAATRHNEESVTVEWRARRYILE